MSTQNATVSTDPAYALLSRLFRDWGTSANGDVSLGCANNVVWMQQVSATWDGAKLTMVGVVNVPCSGTLTGFHFVLMDKNGMITGFTFIRNLSIVVNQGQMISIYYIESLSKPTTAPIQVS